MRTVVCRLCISVGLGAIAPISLFELKDEHPVTSTTEDDRYSYYRTVIKNGFLPYVDRPNLANKAGLAPGVFTVAGLAIAGLDAPPTSSIAALVGRRLYFDISATPEGRRGAPPQLSEAVAAFVGRSGARVVRDVRAADWLVVTERSGDAYWHVSRAPMVRYLARRDLALTFRPPSSLSRVSNTRPRSWARSSICSPTLIGLMRSRSTLAQSAALTQLSSEHGRR